MPKSRAIPEKEYFRNATTWKQISTNVPPKMLEVLKSRVTTDFTMSHLLRELIAESSLMRYGQLPRPSWCAELIDQVAALREEVSAEREMRSGVEKELLELRNEIAELRKDKVSTAQPETSWRQKRQLEQARFLALYEAGEEEILASEPSDNQPVKEKSAYWPIIGRLTAMLGVARKTA